MFVFTLLKINEIEGKLLNKNVHGNEWLFHEKFQKRYHSEHCLKKAFLYKITSDAISKETSAIQMGSTIKARQSSLARQI